MSKQDHMRELAKPFPKHFISDDGRGNDYVAHSIVHQRLIHIFGEPPRIEILRELYDEAKLTGVIMRLTVPGFEPVDEAGEADNPQSKTNGARAKDACSDALKRCAMRLGLGLHLWAQDKYILDRELAKQPEDRSATEGPTDSSGSPSDPPAQPQPSAGQQTERAASPPSASPTEAQETPEVRPSTPSGVTPDDFLNLDWQEIKDSARKAILKLKSGEAMPRNLEKLADLKPETLEEMARTLNLRQAQLA